MGMSAIPALSRYFTTLNPVAGAYYEVPPIALTDFEIEITFATTQADNKLLLCDNHLTSYYLNCGDTIVELWVTGVKYVSPLPIGTVTNDGKLHTVRYKLINSNLTVFFDGELIGSHTIAPYLGLNNFKVGGSNSVAISLGAAFAAIKIWEGGDRVSGTLVRGYRFDDNDGVLVDYASGSDGQAVNVSAADRELMTFNESLNAWVGQVSGNVIEVA